MNRQEYRRSIKYISPYGQQQGKKKKKKQQLKPGEKIFIIISLSSLPAPLNKKTKHPSEIGEVVVYNVDVCLRLSIPAWMTRQEEEEDGALASLSDYLSV